MSDAMSERHGEQSERHGEARPLTIPELRGMPAIPRDRERPYSAKSYAAQYGITVEDAEELVERSTSHQQIHRQILAMFANDPALKRRALMLDDFVKLTPEEEERVRRLLRSSAANLAGDMP